MVCSLVRRASVCEHSFSKEIETRCGRRRGAMAATGEVRVPETFGGRVIGSPEGAGARRVIFIPT